MISKTKKQAAPATPILDDEDYHGPADTVNKLMVEYDEFKQLAGELSAVPIDPLAGPRKRGRPRKTAFSVKTPNDLSPRQIMRNDLLEVAQRWPESVIIARSESLDLQRPARARKLSPTQRAAKEGRDRRIEVVAQALSTVASNRSAQDAANVLQTRGVLPEIKLRTLRQYVTEARKLAPSRPD